MIDPIYKEIGKRIQKYRILSGLTQESLATQMGLTRTSVVHIENGNQRLTIDKLYKISEILNVNIDKLLPKIEDKGPLDSVSKERISEKTQKQIISLIKTKGE